MKPLIYDAHCHIFPEKLAEKATDSIGRFYDLPMSGIGSPSRLLAAMEEAGIAKALVCSTATKPAQVKSINDFITGAVAASEEKFLGFGTMHHELPEEEMCSELERMFSLGLRGLKLHPDFQKMPIDEEAMFPAYEFLSQRGLPVLFHMGDNRYDYSSPERLKKLCRLFPHLKVMAAHLGGYRVWGHGVELLAEEEQVVFDCSSSLALISPEKAREYILRVGTDRVLFGSDFPMWRPLDEIGRVKALGLGEEAEEKLFSGNFIRLFGKTGSWK